MGPCRHFREKKRAINSWERLQLVASVERKDQLYLADLDILVSKNCTTTELDSSRSAALVQQSAPCLLLAVPGKRSLPSTGNELTEVTPIKVPMNKSIQCAEPRISNLLLSRKSQPPCTKQPPSERPSDLDRHKFTPVKTKLNRESSGRGPAKTTDRAYCRMRSE